MQIGEQTLQTHDTLLNKSHSKEAYNNNQTLKPYEIETSQLIKKSITKIKEYNS